MRLPLVLVLAACAASTAFAGRLGGRVILLDPGHGGSAPGMVGPGGTREADMNLLVTRALERQLTLQGARVVLTRTADGDLLSQPAALKDELRARALLADQADADVFSSLHHNATPDNLTPDELLERNHSQVYFKMEDLASRQIGERLLKAFRPLTASPRNKLFPSNFAVLRHNTRPALLGEPFYLSVPLFEQYANEPWFPAFEAGLYLEALEHFLRADRPRVMVENPFPNELITARDLVIEADVRCSHARPDLHFVLDKKPARPRLRWLAPDRFRALFRRIPSGPHELSIVATDRRGRSSRAESRSVTVSAPAERIAVLVLPAGQGAEGVPRIVTATVTDRYGRVVPDGTPVSLSGAPARPTTAGTNSWAAAASGLVAATVTAGEGKERPVRLSREPEPAGWLWGRALDAVTGSAMPSLETSGAAAMAYSTPAGIFVARFSGSPSFLAEGYVPSSPAVSSTTAELPLSMVPVLGGALRAKLVSVDARDLPATAAAALLPPLREAMKAAGARAEGRDEEQAADRVRASNARGDDIYLLLRVVRDETTQLHHYAASARGKALTASIASRLTTAVALDSGEYALSNTSGTGLIAALGTTDLARPARTAVAIVSGLAVGMSPAATMPVPVPAGTSDQPARALVRVRADGRLEAVDGRGPEPGVNR